MRSGIFGDRVGWMRRRIKNGRHAWGPGSPDDSFLVGATRMDSVGLNPSEQTRMFFDKATGAFRAGTATTQWDVASLGTGSAALGGNVSGVSGTASGIGAVSLTGGTASGQSAVTVCGPVTASNSYSFAQGVGQNGDIASASGIGSCALSGSAASGSSATAMTEASAAGGWSVAIGKSATTDSTATFSVAIGNQSRTTRVGQVSFGSGNQFSTPGDAQAFIMSPRASTTDATPTEVQAANSQFVTIPAGRTFSFAVRVAAQRTDVTGTAAAWPTIAGAITRDVAGTARLLGSVTGAGTTTLADAAASTWSVAVTADSTNNRLAITVTGEAAKTIRWVATTSVTEVG